MDAHWDKPPNHVGTKNCILCDKPTRSHALKLVDDDGHIKPMSEDETKDFLVPLCHSCYSEYDGDGALVCERLNERASDNVLRQAGISPTDLKNIVTGVDKRVEDEPTRSGVGENTAKQMILNDVEPGDILNINGNNDAWVTLPIDEDELEDMTAEMVFPVLKVSDLGESESGGGIVFSADPMDDTMYHAYLGETDDEILYEPVERVDVIAHSDELEDGV